MKVQKTADNKIEIEGDSKLFALYNEVNGLVIVATAPIKRARVYFDVKAGFDMVDVENSCEVKKLLVTPVKAQG